MNCGACGEKWLERNGLIQTISKCPLVGEKQVKFDFLAELVVSAAVTAIWKCDRVAGRLRIHTLPTVRIYSFLEEASPD